MQRDAVDFRRLERVGEDPGKNILHGESDGKAVGGQAIARCKRVLDLHGRVTLQANLAS